MPTTYIGPDGQIQDRRDIWSYLSLSSLKGFFVGIWNIIVLLFAAPFSPFFLLSHQHPSRYTTSFQTLVSPSLGQSLGSGETRAQSGRDYRRPGGAPPRRPIGRISTAGSMSCPASG